MKTRESRKERELRVRREASDAAIHQRLEDVLPHFARTIIHEQTGVPLATVDRWRKGGAKSEEMGLILDTIVRLEKVRDTHGRELPGVRTRTHVRRVS
jgi:hypothetical protein